MHIFTKLRIGLCHDPFVEDQAMVTEFKGEDTDPPVNAVTRIAEDQDSDPPVIEAATTYPP
jgi:hypothetical protein